VPHFSFTGTIKKFELRVEGEPHRDPENEARIAQVKQ
jgi:hypothetical protein